MSLQSAVYFGFVLLVWLLGWLMRGPQARQILLLAASYAFYATWGLGFLAVLIVSSLTNYVLGSLIRRHPTSPRLWLGVASNLLLLGSVKYLPAMMAALTAAPRGAGFLQDIVMPVGVSFWTFQALSYLFDTYRQEETDPSVLEFCLYMAFWPTVLSGPICRLPEMLPQFREAWRLEWDDIKAGARRLVAGLFMKVVLAQILGAGLRPGEGVTAGFDEITSGWGGIDVWFLAAGFGFQLFFDFAGYSHIAIGTARLFGIRLAENFTLPYFATTPSAFWTRWHMSLSYWIRDYVFFPLATVRRDPWWRNVALALAMVLFGLWHGPTLTFIVWGAYHGMLLVGHRQGQQFLRRVGAPQRTHWGRSLSWAGTAALISLSWIFFHSRDLQQAFTMLHAVVSPGSYRTLALSPNFYIVTSLVIGGYFMYVGLEFFLSHLTARHWLRQTLWFLSPLYYAAGICLIIVWNVQESAFVYFQF